MEGGEMTIQEVREKHTIVVEQTHPRPYYRDKGCILLLGYEDEYQKQPSWVYMTLPWVDETAVKKCDSVEIYLWESEGFIKPRVVPT
jgi:hypothetical protein